MEARNYCSHLEMQLKYTEFEKMKMAQELAYMGNREPTRPIFAETAYRRQSIVLTSRRRRRTATTITVHRSKTPGAGVVVYCPRPPDESASRNVGVGKVRTARDKSRADSIIPAP